MGRRYTLAAGLAALSGVAAAAAFCGISRRWICPPRVIIEPPESDLVQEVRFTASDGVPLYGWLLRAGATDPGIVLCHGYQRGIEETLSLGFDLRCRGFNVLLFDFRGCGRSGGRYTSIGYYEPRDVVGALRWLSLQLGADVRLALAGISMGGAVALTAAAAAPQVSAVVADSAFATLRGAVDRRFHGLGPLRRLLYTVSLHGAQWQARARVDAVRPIDAARRLRYTPVLLIHGTADGVVPYHHARELEAALTGPHELWTLPGVPHAMARFRMPDAYLDRVSAFLDRHLRIPSGG